MIRRKTILLLIFLSFVHSLSSQVVYEPVSKHTVYGFLDEMASEGIVDLSTAVKPYSRTFIAKCLADAEKKSEEMTPRQKKDLAFFIKNYSFELRNEKLMDYAGIDILQKKRAPNRELEPFRLFAYRDSTFRFMMNPIIGVSFMTNQNGNCYRRYSGAEASAYAGKNFGFYANLRDHFESSLMSDTGFLNGEQGALYKFTQDGFEYEDVQGGVTYKGKWGEIGLVKDKFIWGNNQHGSNIFSDKIPSPAQITMHLYPAEWFEFHYIHAWLVSGITDSSRSFTHNGVFRRVMREKYLAANLFTFRPWKRLNLSIGNSVVYSDIGVHPVYLIPVMFYKAADHSINGMSNNTGQNSQMFLDVSSRQIKHLHLYGSFFMDELNIGNLFKDTLQTNFFSMKGGFTVSGIKPLRNVSATFEYTRTNPLVYKHFIETTTFASNEYFFGHYLRDNAQEYYVGLKYKPLRGLLVGASYTLAQKGPDYPYISKEAKGKPFLSEVIWQMETYDLAITYEWIRDLYIRGNVRYTKPSGDVYTYLPELYRIESLSFTIGVNLGF